MILRKALALWPFIVATAICLSPAVSTAGGVQNVTVVELTIYMGTTLPGALVKFSPAAQGLEGCSYSVGDYVFINFAAQTVPSGRDVYASVLAAYMAGRSIGIGTNGCNSSGYPIVYGVNVNPQ